MEASQRFEKTDSEICVSNSQQESTVLGEICTNVDAKKARMDYKLTCTYGASFDESQLGASHPCAGQQNRLGEPVPTATPYQPICEPLSAESADDEEPYIQTNKRFIL